MSDIDYEPGEVLEALNDKMDLDGGNVVASSGSAFRNITNWSNNMTNCITYIPQDIKLELDSGTLTLKAGSKVYVPNGFEEDGTTPKFDVITVASDLTLGPIGTATTQSEIYILNDGSGFAQSVANMSGTTAPTGSAIWYDTNTNLMKWYNGGTDTGYRYSLPIALASRTSGSWTSIDQIFNGFGYIGSTVFALPGVKGLFCNGKNTDGTSSSTPFELSNVLVNHTFNNNATSYFVITRDLTIARSHADNTSYDEANNWIYRSDGLYKDGMIAGILQSTTSGIQWFNPKQVFHALDYNDGDYISGLGMPAISKYQVLTLGANGSSYTAPANGYFSLGGNDDQTVNGRYVMRNDTTRFGVSANTNGTSITTGWMAGTLPVRKGDIVNIYYNTVGPTGMNFIFVYAEGEV